MWHVFLILARELNLSEPICYVLCIHGHKQTSLYVVCTFCIFVLSPSASKKQMTPISDVKKQTSFTIAILMGRLSTRARTEMKSQGKNNMSMLYHLNNSLCLWSDPSLLTLVFIIHYTGWTVRFNIPTVLTFSGGGFRTWHSLFWIEMLMLEYLQILYLYELASAAPGAGCVRIINHTSQTRHWQSTAAVKCELIA